MNIVLWILQGLLALLFAAGSVQQLFTYDKLAGQYAIYKALPQAFWIGYAVVAILCCLGLLLTRVWPIATPIAATVLAVQGVIFASLYAYHAGFQPSFAMWAAWTARSPLRLSSPMRASRLWRRHERVFRNRLCV